MQQANPSPDPHAGRVVKAGRRAFGEERNGSRGETKRAAARLVPTALLLSAKQLARPRAPPRLRLPPVMSPVRRKGRMMSPNQKVFDLELRSLK